LDTKEKDSGKSEVNKPVDAAISSTEKKSNDEPILAAAPAKPAEKEETKGEFKVAGKLPSATEPKTAPTEAP
jgi:hypothetical protein